MKDHVKGGALTEVTLYVLLSLYSPNHGYGVMQFIEEQTRGRLVLGAGTLYGALTSLADKGWISQQGEEGIKRKKIYMITDLGKDVVRREMLRLQDVLSLGREIIEKEDYSHE